MAAIEGSQVLTTRCRLIRVSRQHLCPICAKHNWCSYSEDGAIAICMRVSNGAIKQTRNGGWLHRLRELPWQPTPGHVHHVWLPASREVRADLTQLATRFRATVNPDNLHRLGISLGLSVNSLNRLGIGWSEDHRAWSFPMVDCRGNVLGIRLRQRNGFKFAVTGGHDGLFVPHSQENECGGSPLIICEGATDTAAVLDLGFSLVVGRPSCTGGAKLLIELVNAWKTADVVILSDGDDAGRRGAETLAALLLAYLKIVRIIEPPAGIKDARAWLRAGATHPHLMKVMEAAPVRRLLVRTRKVRT